MISHSSTQLTTAQGKALGGSSWCLAGGCGCVGTGSALSYRGSLRAQLSTGASVGVGSGAIGGHKGGRSVMGALPVVSTARPTTAGTPVEKRPAFFAFEGNQTLATIARLNGSNDPRHNSGAGPGR